MNTCRTKLNGILVCVVTQAVVFLGASAAIGGPNGDIYENAPILGRIIEKNLQKVDAKPNAVQWAQIPGYGVL